MFVLWRRNILERSRSIARYFILCNCLLLLVHAAHGGAYQRTRDGKTLVWNNYPSKDDVASWSGARDASGYATGKGTLTWYRTEKGFRTGSLLPAKGAIVAVSRYSGKMVRGKFNGPVLSVDADGKKFQLTFVDGVKRRERTPEPTPVPDQQHNEHLSEITPASTPAEGPVPSPIIEESPTKTGFRGMMAEGESASRPIVAKATPSPSGETPIVEVASIRSTPSAAAAPSSSQEGIDSAVKDRIIADFREETQTVLSQVGEATGNFRGVDQLDSVTKLPAAVSEGVGSLVQRARNFRSKVGYETALRDYRAETETVDGLSTVNQVTRSIASNDVLEANSKLADFLKNNPEARADNQKPLWQYLNSMQQLFGRLQKDADTHLQRAQSLAAAGRPSEAIQEYQEAYRVFPNPATAEKIRQLQTNSLGL